MHPLYNNPGEQSSLKNYEIDQVKTEISRTESYLQGQFLEHKLLTYATLAIAAIIFGTIGGANLALVVVTALLYLSIVYVNHDLKDVQKQQLKIREQQFRPLLELVDLNAVDNDCEIRLSNYGEHSAIGLTIVLKTHILEESDLESGTGYTFLNKSNNHGSEHLQSSILPNTEDESYTCIPEIGFGNGENLQSMPVEVAIEKLHASGVDAVNFQLAIVYANSLGEVGYRVRRPRAVNIEKDMNFQDFYENSYPLGGYELDIFPKFGLDDIIHTRDVEELKEPKFLR